VRGSFTCALKLDLARHVDPLFSVNWRRRFELADQPVHVGFERIDGTKRGDVNCSKAMATRLLNRVQRRDRP